MFPASHSRSRQGCLTCRDKKVKCDETRPRCQRCIRLNRDCDYGVRGRKKYTRRAQQASSLDLASCPKSSLPHPSPDAPSSLLLSDQEQLYCSTSSTDLSSPALVFEASHTVSPHYTLPDKIVLSKFDYEAIDYVRFIMAPKVDTRLPDYGGPAVIWTLSQNSPMVLHMLCALGSMKLCHNHSATEIPRRKSEATAHYGAGLRMLNSAIHHLSHESDLDFILATLWLMISYELAHGDGTGSDLSVHLRGAALLLQGRLRGVDKQALGGKPGGRYQITPLTAQLLLWIAMVDGSAALNGFEATFNNLLGDSMLDGTNNDPAARLKGFSQLQRQATTVYHNFWGTNYPQNELIGDLQCSQIFCLQAEVGQLRYMLSTIIGRSKSEQAPTERLEAAILDVEQRYNDIITSTSLLQLPNEGPQRRYVLNLRMIVPFYHAVVLLFYRLLSDHPSTLRDRQRLAMRETMALAFQAYTDEGIRAVYRIAWPLFIAALELDDLIHQAWVLERFEVLAQEGENLRRAHAALSLAFSRQKLQKRRVGYLELLHDKELKPFVLE